MKSHRRRSSQHLHCWGGVIFIVVSGVVLISVAASTTCFVVEGCDGSEALARSISYVLSRPLRTLTLLAFVVILSYGVSSLTTLLIDAAFRLHNARTEFGVFSNQQVCSENLQTVVWQTAHLSTLFAGVSVCLPAASIRRGRREPERNSTLEIRMVGAPDSLQPSVILPGTFCSLPYAGIGRGWAFRIR